MQEKLFNRLMDVIEYDVAPLTRKRVAIGCKVFGAAVLRKDDLSLVLAETNMGAFSPLWHGEVYAIKQFWELQGHPDPKDCIFIATHQPCCMCASAIAWSGFPELFYLFGYENTSKDFHIPHDQKMIRELFHCTSPAEDSSYYTSRPIMGLCDTPEAAARFERIKNLYAELSADAPIKTPCRWFFGKAFFVSGLVGRWFFRGLERSSGETGIRSAPHGWNRE